MAIKNKRIHNKKNLLSIVVIGVVLALIVTGIAYTTKTGPFKKSSDQNTINYDGATEQEKAAGDAKKAETIDQSEASKNNTDTSNVDQNTQGTVGMRITAANQSAGTLSIRTLIDTVTSEGTCTLTMKSANGAIYTKSVAVQALPSSTTCAGFDIPVSELSQGRWTIEIVYKNSTTTGSATGSVDIT